LAILPVSPSLERSFRLVLGSGQLYWRL
jgi:hypothetical protein